MDDRLQAKVPISGGIHKIEGVNNDKSFTLCKMLSGDIGVYSIRWNEDGIYIFGIWYDPMSVNENPDITFNYKTDDLMSYTNDHIILSPSLSHIQDDTHYSAVSSNCLVHDSNNRYTLPSLNDDSFNFFR